MITSLARDRIGYRAWRAVHWLSYACWPIARDPRLRNRQRRELDLAARAHRRSASSRSPGRSSGGSRAAGRVIRRERLAGAAALVVFLIFLVAWLPGGPLGASLGEAVGYAGAPGRRDGPARRADAALDRRRRNRAPAPRRRILRRVAWGIRGRFGRIGGQAARPGSEAERTTQNTDDHRGHAPPPARRHRPGRPADPAAPRRAPRPAAALTRADRRRCRARAGRPARPRRRVVPVGAQAAVRRAGAGQGDRAVNAAEAEPASEKDRLLVECLPHLVLDGAVAAAARRARRNRLRGARRGRTMPRRGRARDPPNGRAASRRSPCSTCRTPTSAARRRLSSNYLSGGPLRPTFTPPRPAERGINRRPTLVNNAETLAHLALIARNGAQWFRALGAPDAARLGARHRLGAVSHPGVFEIEYGSPIGSLLNAAGGRRHAARGPDRRLREELGPLPARAGRATRRRRASRRSAPACWPE